MIRIHPDFLEDAQQCFGELHNVRKVMTKRESGAISLGRLYAYVQGAQDDAVQDILGRDLKVRRVYRSLLQKSALVHMPQALAASTQDYPERHADGCHIRLQASRAQSDQLYLIVEMSDQRRDMPQSLHLFGPDETMVRVALPAARNGVIQTIIEKNSDAARLLGEPKTEIFLR
ncbi:hypothetical protein [Terasakiella sp.]|uniref:hypothetical protein n=1 Tax=Terasakiella sp. TaxID=2034861 RepID=UPI003AA9D1C4